MHTFEKRKKSNLKKNPKTTVDHKKKKITAIFISFISMFEWILIYIVPSVARPQNIKTLERKTIFFEREKGSPPKTKPTPNLIKTFF